MKITLEPIGATRPSTYNPRSAVPERLDLIELSLRKLGFIAPIFADADGEILSGHQRHLVAERMGATHLPVFRTKALDLDQRKALNIVFNRATNDFDFHHTPGKVAEVLDECAHALRVLDPETYGRARVAGASFIEGHLPK